MKKNNTINESNKLQLMKYTKPSIKEFGNMTVITQGSASKCQDASPSDNTLKATGQSCN